MPFNSRSLSFGLLLVCAGSQLVLPQEQTATPEIAIKWSSSC